MTKLHQSLYDLLILGELRKLAELIRQTEPDEKNFINEITAEFGDREAMTVKKWMAEAMETANIKGF